MSSVRHCSPLQHLEGSHDDDEDRAPHLIPFFPVYDPAPFAFSLRSPQHHPLLHHHREDDDSSPSGGPSDPFLFMVSLPTEEDREEEKQQRLKQQQQQHSCDARENGTVKWMSSKMRLMRKMMSSDAGAARKAPRRSAHSHAPQDDQQHPEGIIRVCSDCNTTKTPLWRSGPQGPKSLCNACGIRQRKARKAMAAAAAATANASEARGPPTDHMASASTKEQCLLELGDDHQPIVPFKKRSKFAMTVGTVEAERLEDQAAMGRGQQQQQQHLTKVFPQDEKEAAILLMALSCGLVCR